ncbi:hypothetical protein [Kitasatospora sp. KL5]|uniref:hypothetical protein n=1 Tax=Kitasatospora sp. KL5 TaxID=3425125 RepID=UPI003D6DDD60
MALRRSDAGVAVLLSEIPAFAGHLRAATLLRPRAGTPVREDSSVGGPLLWPAGEEWPLCTAAHLVETREKLTDRERETCLRIDRERREWHVRHPDRPYRLSAEDAAEQTRVMAGAGVLDLIAWERVRWVPDTTGSGVPMVPVVQLFARDVPGVPWPPGTDVLQLLWCPNDHAEQPAQPGYWGPAVDLRFRASQAVRQHRVPPPRPDRADRSYLPHPCTVAPVRIAELPDPDELPAELSEAGEAWAEEHGVEFHRCLACRPGWKVGGWPSWHQTDLVPVECDCGAAMRLLLTLDSGGDPHLNVGRFGELRVFTCPVDGSHPFRLNLQ